MHACRAVILLASWRHGGMAPMTAEFERKYTGSLGRTGGGDEKRVSPSVSVTSCSAWGSAWGTD